MHRDDVTDPHPPTGPRTVHRHCEFVTLCDRDPVAAKGGLEPACATQRDRPIQPQILHGDPCTCKLARQPALAVCRDDDQVTASGRLKLGRQARQHPLGPARPVRFDQVRNSRASDLFEGIGAHMLGVQCGRRPLVHTSKAAAPIVAGTLTLGRAHRSAPSQTRP